MNTILEDTTHKKQVKNDLGQLRNMAAVLRRAASWLRRSSC